MFVFLFYWGVTPQQQPGSYRSDDGDMSVSLVEEAGAPGGNRRPTCVGEKSACIGEKSA